MSDNHRTGAEWTDPGQGDGDRDVDRDVDPSARSPRLRRGLLAYAAIILVVGWSYGLWQIQVERQLTLESSENQLILSTTGFANHVGAMINDGVGAAIAGANEARAASLRQPITDAQMATLLARMLTGGDYVQTLFLVTPTRFAAAHQNGGETTGVPPDYLQHLLVSKDRTWVGGPQNTGQGDANVLVPVARRVPGLNGETMWAGALLSFASLDAIYRTLPVEYSGLALTHVAGIVLVRVPTVPGFKFAGTDLSGFPATQEYLRRATQPLVTYVAPDPFSGNARQFAVRTIDEYPLRATASRDLDNALLGWRARTRVSLLTLSAATLAVIGVTTALFTALQRRFDALRHSRERFQLAVAGSSAGIWDWEVDTNRVYYSARLRELLGLGPTDEFRPNPDTFWDLMHPDDLEDARGKVQRHLQFHEPYDAEYRVRTQAGQYRWFRARAQAVWDAAGKPLRMAGSITDIHERRTAEQSLFDARERELHAREEFAQHLLQAQETERQRLANELHDSVGQNLSLIKNRALLVLQDKELSQPAAAHVLALSELTSDVIAEVRSVAQNLRPLHIEQLGLTDALETLLDKLAESGIRVERRVEHVDDVLKGDAATHVYRIVQEAFNNVLKHAKATQCSLLLERDLRCVRLTVSDNGLGFDPNADASRHGLGLGSFAERARMLSAQLHIASAPDAGTTVHLEIPVHEGTVGDSPSLATQSSLPSLAKS